MFIRRKKSGKRTYLQVVKNRWENGASRQRIIATLGRLEELQDSGDLDGLVRSAARFCDSVLVIESHERGDSPAVSTRSIGPAMIFERLWTETGCSAVLNGLAEGRKFGFSLERAIFLTVLHRLFDPGSGRSAMKWRSGYEIADADSIDLHQLYRAMAWLGEELPTSDQADRTPFSPRCTKDLVEEQLFLERRDLFSSLDLVFFDTTSIYFQGEGGETLGEHGNSKDHRPDLKQMVVGVVLDESGQPVCSEMWPGNTSDVKTLLPIVQRLRGRFGIGRVCVVADRGMISKGTVEQLEQQGLQYILGARMRRVKTVRDKVLGRAGRYKVVHPASEQPESPSPLKVKEVMVDGLRYVICLNEDQRKKDAADREAILGSLRDKLKQGSKSLVGNKGYRKYLTSKGAHFAVDEEAVEREAQFDGKWVLQTNTDLTAADVALKYKELWMVEEIFRTVKSLLETRPVFHKRDETIRGHVFCSFLALILRKELHGRLQSRGHSFEWSDIIRDLDRLAITEVDHNDKRFLLRSDSTGCCGKVFQSVGVALPPTVRQVELEEAR